MGRRNQSMGIRDCVLTLSSPTLDILPARAWQDSMRSVQVLKRTPSRNLSSECRGYFVTGLWKRGILALVKVSKKERFVFTLSLVDLFVDLLHTFW